MKRFICVIAAMCLIGTACAAWSAEDANLAHYESIYGQATAKYQRIKYGANGNNIQAIKEQLASLGFFANRINQSYFRTLEIASRVFCQQMRIGGDGSEISPLMQAMLADAANLPRAICPGIDIYGYSRDTNTTQYVPYTYAYLIRANTRQDVKVGFVGHVDAVYEMQGTQVLSLRLDADVEKQVYVTYTPLPRTTRFQAGDDVSVFGVTQGLQVFSYPGMEAEKLTIRADQVGYAK